MYSFSGMYELWGLFIMNFTDRYRYRCRHLKLVPFHLLSQLDLTRFWDRVLRRAGSDSFLKVLILVLCYHLGRPLLLVL